MAAPPKPRELNKDEVGRIVRQREAVLRELRVFLRDATNKLLAERKFKEFVKPVDPEEVRGEWVREEVWVRVEGMGGREEGRRGREEGRRGGREVGEGKGRGRKGGTMGREEEGRERGGERRTVERMGGREKRNVGGREDG